MNSVTALINNIKVECWIIGQRDPDPKATVWVCEKADPDQSHLLMPEQIIRTYQETR